MAKRIMIQGTMSNSGKSVVTAGLCRIFTQDGFRVSPFKSQNMALNSYITRDGFEMGRAQVMQAEAACVEPSVLMNPILLKPTNDTGSQVIVNGEVVGNMGAADYYKYKKALVPDILRAFDTLAAQSDIVAIEGAGSPAEINLKSGDFVNMGLAELVDAPVLLVGDIDRGGVFASVYGTVMLLEPQERARIRGILINKFRGDVEILRPGLKTLEELTGIPVLGVIPYMQLDLDDEDSLSERFDRAAPHKAVDVAVVRLPRISNFTDFNALGRHPQIGVRYVKTAAELGAPDLVILPGTKNTMGDLLWMRQNGLEAQIKKYAAAGGPVVGICGGYQMLGETLSDPDGVEQGGKLRGLGLLPVDTVFAPQKTRTRVSGTVGAAQGLFAGLRGAALEGYEIHMGVSTLRGDGVPAAEIALADANGAAATHPDGAAQGNVLGSYVHGFFDSGEVVAALAEALVRAKGMEPADAAQMSDHDYKQRQYDLLAQGMRAALDMGKIYEIMDEFDRGGNRA